MRIPFAYISTFFDSLSTQELIFWIYQVYGTMPNV